MSEESFANEREAIVGHHTAMLEQLGQFHDAKALIEEMGGEKSKAIAQDVFNWEKASLDQRMQHMKQFAGDTANMFKFLAGHASKHNEEMFAAYKAFAIVQTMIQTYEGAQKAFTALAGIPIVGPALGAAAAAAAIAAGMMRVGMIRKQEPPGYATGGVSTGPESGYPVTLHGAEAVVPLPDGRDLYRWRFRA